NKLIQNISSQSEKLQFEMDSDEVETKQKHVALLQQNITQFFENLNTLQDEITYEISDILTETTENQKYIQKKFEDLSIMNFVNDNFSDILEFMKTYKQSTIDIFGIDIDENNKELSKDVGDYYEVALDELHDEDDDEDDDDIELF
ncbi:MAG: hypothetical protein U9N34_07255, partial [Candidatus Cloacimonadota bacterium]|nr:hypothetical protein [Candidatus Cloacimonadota bacterium]